MYQERRLFMRIQTDMKADGLLPERESLKMMPGDVSRPSSDADLLEEVDHRAAENLLHKDKASPARIAQKMERESQHFKP
jgi:hypothetical protein